jgi:hypothetical protein
MNVIFTEISSTVIILNETHPFVRLEHHKSVEMLNTSEIIRT